MAANLYTAAVNSVFTLVVKCVEDQKTLTNELSTTQSNPGSSSTGGADAWSYARTIGNYFHSAAEGSKSINVSYSDGASSGFATGTITFTANPANSDSIVIAGVTVTLVTGTPSGSQVKIGSTLAATIANIVTFINAGGSASNLQSTVTAVATSGTVITVNAYYPGLLGNLVTMTKTSTAISAITSPLAGGIMVNAPSSVSIGI